MSLKFNEIKIDKKEFHKSKQPIDLNFIDTSKIVISDTLKYTNDGFKYFLGCLSIQRNKKKTTTSITMRKTLLIIKIFGKR